MSQSSFLLVAVFLAAVAASAHAGPREAVILYDWARHPAKTAEPPAGVMRIAERLDVTFDSRHDGEWAVNGDVQTWSFSIRVPGASSLAADFSFDAVPGAVLEVAGEHLIRSEGRYISAHSGAETISFYLNSPAQSGRPTVQVNSLRLSEPALLSKIGEGNEDYVPYSCNATPELDPASRATGAICIDGVSCCTAVLLNNFRGADGGPSPIVATAEHCQPDSFRSSPSSPDLPPSAYRFNWSGSDLCEASPRTLSFTGIGAREQQGATHLAEWQDRSIDGGNQQSKGDLWLLELDQWPDASIDAWLVGIDAREGAQPGASCFWGGQGPCPDSYYVAESTAIAGQVFGLHHGGTRPLQYLSSPAHSYQHTSSMPGSLVPMVQVDTAADGGVGDSYPGSSGSGLFTQEYRFFATLNGSSANFSLYYPTSGPWVAFGLAEVLTRQVSDQAPRIIEGRSAPIPPPSPTIQLTSSPSNITLGGATIIQWEAQNADVCVASGDWTGDRQISGQETVTPSAAGRLTFTLTCTNEVGDSTRTTSVMVSSADESGGSSGGGAIDIALLALALLGSRRRWGGGKF
jgi:hypothetical protein